MSITLTKDDLSNIEKMEYTEYAKEVDKKIRYVSNIIKELKSKQENSKISITIDDVVYSSHGKTTKGRTKRRPIGTIANHSEEVVLYTDIDVGITDDNDDISDYMIEYYTMNTDASKIVKGIVSYSYDNKTAKVNIVDCFGTTEVDEILNKRSLKITPVAKDVAKETR